MSPDFFVSSREASQALNRYTYVQNAPRTTVLYQQTDHLGSVTALVDQSGTVRERLGFDAWRLRRQVSGQDDPNAPPDNLKGAKDNKGYTGHEHLDDVELVHMNGRIYDPVIGRFTSGDPFTVGLDGTQVSNRYSYVNNGPLRASDPTGYAEEVVVQQGEAVTVTGNPLPGKRAGGSGLSASISFVFVSPFAVGRVEGGKLVPLTPPPNIQVKLPSKQEVKEIAKGAKKFLKSYSPLVYLLLALSVQGFDDESGEGGTGARTEPKDLQEGLAVEEAKGALERSTK